MKYTAGISVTTSDREDHAKAVRVFSGVANDLAAFFPDLNVHAYTTDGSEELIAEASGEYFDEYTMFKVLKAIMSFGLKEQSAMDVISALQKAGILFREYDRGKDLTIQRTPTKGSLVCPYCPHRVMGPNDSLEDNRRMTELLDTHIRENHSEKE